MHYNVDISLTIRYLNDIFNNTAYTQETYFGKISMASFRNFANI